MAHVTELPDRSIPPDAAQRERLEILIEEMAEAIQVATKILRNGFRPIHQGIAYDNVADLHREIGDVEAALIRMERAGDINPARVHERSSKKLAPGGTLLRHQ